MMTELSVDLRNGTHKTQQDLIKTKLTMEKFGVLWVFDWMRLASRILLVPCPFPIAAAPPWNRPNKRNKLERYSIFLHFILLLILLDRTYFIAGPRHRQSFTVWLPVADLYITQSAVVYLCFRLASNGVAANVLIVHQDWVQLFPGRRTLINSISLRFICISRWAEKNKREDTHGAASVVIYLPSTLPLWLSCLWSILDNG